MDVLPITREGEIIAYTEPESIKSDFTQKYWDRDYINDRINRIDNTGHKMLMIVRGKNHRSSRPTKERPRL
jgi:hypothetical protein